MTGKGGSFPPHGSGPGGALSTWQLGLLDVVHHPVEFPLGLLRVGGKSKGLLEIPCNCILSRLEIIISDTSKLKFELFLFANLNYFTGLNETHDQTACFNVR